MKRVFVARYFGPGLGGSAREVGMLAGVVVEALPALGCALRRVALPGRFETGDRSLDAGCLNREVRTIARVVVHPMFRSTGLAVGLVRRVLESAEVPYVEALAAMGRVHPFFERAGMRAFDRPPGREAVRLMAALEREGLRAVDLADGGRVGGSLFLDRELRRFAGGRGKDRGEWIAIARGRLLSRPVYYLWKKGEGNVER